MTTAITFEDVSVRFGGYRFNDRWRLPGRFGRGVQALDGLTLDVEAGSIFGLLGPNGAGKSTAVYVALGLIHPDRGACRVFGQVLERGAEIFRDIGFLPEEAHYHGDLTVREALTYYAQLTDPKRAWPIDETLERVGMLESANRRLGACSKGMRQRLGLAQAVIHRPRLIILDEPTRGLDPIAVHTFRVIIEDLTRGGTTIFLNSHVLSEVELFCTRVAILEHGRVVLQGALRDLLTVGDQFRVRYATENSCGITNATRHDGQWEAFVPESQLDQTWSKLRSAGATIHLIERRRQTLEELFVKTVSGVASPPTGRGAGATSAEPVAASDAMALETRNSAR